MTAPSENWIELADRLKIKLPAGFLKIHTDKGDHGLAWKFLSAGEALTLKAELDLRFDYPGREWKGIPFARSTISEDVACFDLDTPPGQEARVIPIRDWHGPRWEFEGYKKSFEQWIDEY
jgi:hypothetical protein